MVKLFYTQSKTLIVTKCNKLWVPVKEADQGNHRNEDEFKYRKIPRISPGANNLQRTFLRGLYSDRHIYMEVLIIGGKFVSKSAGFFIGGKFGVDSFFNIGALTMWRRPEIRDKVIPLDMPTSNTTAINFIENGTPHML